MPYTRWAGIAARPVAVVVCALGLTACAMAGRSSAGPADAAATARRYVEAYNRRDGKEICRLFAREVREQFERQLEEAGLGDRIDCAKFIAGYIGYGEESDTPTFVSVRVLGVEPHVDGETARVRVRERYHYKAFPSPRTFSFVDELHLLARDGRWQVAKPGGIYFLSRSAYQVPPSVLDPPLTAAEAHAAAPQPAARFSCRGRTVQDLHDPAGDAPRSLDVRRLVALVDEQGNVCFRIAFAARPEPGTLVDVELDQPIPGDRRGTFHVIAFGVRIGHAGVLRVGSTRSRVPPPVAAGWHDGELTLLWRAPSQRLDGHDPFRISLKVESFQRDEPFVRDPLEARDSVGAPRT